MVEKQKILIVDDDENIAELISLYLTKECFDTSIVNDGESALKEFERYQPNLILLDLMLPYGNGMDILKTLRNSVENNDIKIIILSAKRMTMDKVEGLDCGADDYIEKPCDILELIARVNARFRLDHEILSYHDISLDLNRHTCTYQGKSIDLTNTEFSILKLLLQNLGKAITRDEIYHKLYTENDMVESRAIDMHIASLRKKLNDKESHIIHTIYGVGYIIG